MKSQELILPRPGGEQELRHPLSQELQQLATKELPAEASDYYSCPDQKRDINRFSTTTPQTTSWALRPKNSRRKPEPKTDPLKLSYETLDFEDVQLERGELIADCGRGLSYTRDRCSNREDPPAGIIVEYYFSKFLSQCFEDRVIKNISRPIYRFAFYLAGN